MKTQDWRDRMEKGMWYDYLCQNRSNLLVLGVLTPNLVIPYNDTARSQKYFSVIAGVQRRAGRLRS